MRLPAMKSRREPIRRDTAAEREMRDQEVGRANRELAAYFKGLRTEREARAALKIIKAYVRERELEDPRRRPPLPGQRAAATRKQVRAVKTRARRAPAPHASADERPAIDEPSND
jgi:hypothetical protein